MKHRTRAAVSCSALLFWSGLLCAVLPAGAGAQTVGSTAAAPVVDMATVQVSGEQPGPGLWKVTAANGHVLWVLGTVSPMPQRVEWRSDEVQRVIDQADHVLGAPGWTIDADIGFFRGLTLLPLARRTARDPQGRSLQDVLPPASYARWLRLKQANMGRDRSVEKERPMAASARLYGAFLKRNGLRDGRQVRKALEDAYDRNDLKPEDTRLKLEVGNVRDTLRQMQSAEVDDRACFERTLDTVDYMAPVLRERATAWAVGDVAALRRLAVSGMAQTCLDAVVESDMAKRRGWTQLEARSKARWLQLAQGALATHSVTFATLPVSRMLGTGNYLDALAQRGFTVEAPPE